MKSKSFLLFLLTTTISQARLNTKNANFNDTWIDLKIPGTDFSFSRTYNSRSIFHDKLGFGWCSNLDFRLKRKPNNSIEIYHCDKLVTRISNSSSFTFNKDGKIYKFNGSGRLIWIEDKKRTRLYIAYNFKNQISSLRIREHSIKFHYDLLGKLRNISSPTLPTVFYKYKHDDLIWMKNAWGNQYHYHYDDVHNLNRIDYPDGTSRTIWLDRIKDRVRSYITRNNCLYNVEYKFSKTEDYYMATISSNCKSEKLKSTNYEFWYSTGVNGKVYLDKFRKNSALESIEVYYHPRTGRPLRVFDKLNETHIQFDPEGRLIVKNSPTMKMLYNYNSNGKISSIKTVEKATKKSKRYFYIYNEKGLLSKIENSLGPIAIINYDSAKRVSSIIDSRSQVYFSYINDGRKPSAVSESNIVPIISKQLQTEPLHEIELAPNQTTIEKILQLVNPIKNANKLKKSLTKDIWIHQEGDHKCVI